VLSAITSTAWLQPVSDIVKGKIIAAACHGIVMSSRNLTV
jgi:hypothetical protein